MNSKIRETQVINSIVTLEACTAAITHVTTAATEDCYTTFACQIRSHEE
jgi:hypothetical protein